MKKCFLKVLVVLSVLVLFSCNNGLSMKPENIDKISFSEEIVLGEQRENPFLLSKARSVDSTVEANYVYFRIRTNVFENVEKIEDILGDLNTVPLDFEVKDGGCDNPLNMGTEEASPWFYSMLPIETFNEVEPFGEIEIINEMYISEEDLAKFSEVDTNSKNEDARFLWFNYQEAKPSGYVYYYDEVKNCYCPLSGVKVTVSQWCHVKSTYTDENGYYNIGTNFTSCWQNTANVKITFETNKDVVYPEWSVVKASYNAGDKKVKNLSKNNIYLAKTTKQNNFGILTNAANMYRKFAKADGIIEPQNLKFWAGSGMVGGLTLMQDVVAADLASIGSAIGSIGGTPWAVAGAVAGGLIGSYFPDIMISTRAENMTQTESITEYVFHEMAHASHYTGIGLGNVTYWNLEYIKMLGGWVEVLANGSSPLQDCYNGGKSKQVCLIESWGYFYGYYLMNKYYGGYATKIDYRLRLINSDNFYPYFYYDAFYDISKVNSIKRIFDPYKFFSVQSVESWYSKYVDLNKDIDSSGEIKKIFKEHGIAL